MSQENVDLAYRATDALNRRDLDAWLALTHPDVEFTSRVSEMEGGGPYRGHDGARSWWENLFGVFPDFSSEIEEARDLGDVTVVRVRQRARGIGSDAPTEQTSWVVTEWRDGKGIWTCVYRSEAEALEAAGLEE